jgi:hypothetical protein
MKKRKKKKSFSAGKHDDAPLGVLIRLFLLMLVGEANDGGSDDRAVLGFYYALRRRNNAMDVLDDVLVR